MAPKKARVRAALYLRISQDRDGNHLGIDRQREDCAALCERRGWTITETFVDDDISAYSNRKKRPGYRAMLDGVKAGTIDAVVAWHPDRLHRSPKDLEEFIEIIEAARAQVATVQAGDLDLSTATGRMTARVVGAVARHESEQKAERVRRQREQSARTGNPHPGGRRAFGYNRDATIIEAEADLAREGARRLLAGESLRRIAEDWNARGLKSPSGVPWRITTLRSILTGPRLAGLRVHRGEVIGDGTWPAILDRDTHERIRAIVGDPRRRQRGRPPVHLLSGLIRCGSCGGTLHASRRPNGTRRYACAPTPGAVNCGRLAVVAEPLEHLITQAFLHRITAPAVKRAMNRKRQPGKDHGAEIADCERRLEDLSVMFANGDLSRREWTAARERLQDRLTTARRALATERGAEVAATFDGADPRAAWEALDVARRRDLLRVYIDHIVVKPWGGKAATVLDVETGLTFVNPDRVDVEWKA